MAAHIPDPNQSDKGVPGHGAGPQRGAPCHSLASAISSCQDRERERGASDNSEEDETYRGGGAFPLAMMSLSCLNYNLQQERRRRREERGNTRTLCVCRKIVILLIPLLPQSWPLMHTHTKARGDRPHYTCILFCIPWLGQRGEREPSRSQALSLTHT